MILFLSDIAGSEILLILVFILIFFGSKSIPGIARTAGKTIRQIKEASDGIQNEIRKTGMDIKKDMNLTQIIEQTANDIQKPLQAYAQDIDQAMQSDSPVKIQAPEKIAEAESAEQLSSNDSTVFSNSEPLEIAKEKPKEESPSVQKVVLKTKFPKL